MRESNEEYLKCERTKFGKLSWVGLVVRQGINHVGGQISNTLGVTYYPPNVTLIIDFNHKSLTFDQHFNEILRVPHPVAQQTILSHSLLHFPVDATKSRSKLMLKGVSNVLSDNIC